MAARTPKEKKLEAIKKAASTKAYVHTSIPGGRSIFEVEVPVSFTTVVRVEADTGSDVETIADAAKKFILTSADCGVGNEVISEQTGLRYHMVDVIQENIAILAEDKI